MEEENDNRLPFLDVMVPESGTSFLTPIMKSTFTGQSVSAKRRKMALICSLVKRAKRICSPTLLLEELGKTRDIFYSFVVSQMVIRSVSLIDMGRSQRKRTLGWKFS